MDGQVHTGRQNHDAGQTAWLAKEGIRVLRFAAARIETRLAAVLKTIAKAAPPPPPDGGTSPAPRAGEDS